MNTQHTPSPWKVFPDYHDDEDSLDYKRIISDGCLIAEKVTECDANLIASAPVLLGELEASTAILIALRAYIGGGLSVVIFIIFIVGVL